jgi:hypothetical protein
MMLTELADVAAAKNAAELVQRGFDGDEIRMHGTSMQLKNCSIAWKVKALILTCVTSATRTPLPASRRRPKRENERP